MGSDLWAKKHEQAPGFCLPDDTLSGDRFDDWVGGWQFGPYRLHHPVFRAQTLTSLLALIAPERGFFADSGRLWIGLYRR
jgi:hypothetical protein